MRTAYNRTFDVNVTSVAMAMDVFLPLLRESPHGQVINVSSARGSLELSSSGQLPPTVAMAYCASKTALNMLTVEYGKASENRNVIFQSISPGHCKTEFNNYRGRKEPLDGAKVIVALLGADSGDFGSGFWQMEEGDVLPVRVPW
jgi:NAD(P)-dependent dehydrogenase (short-subunit alcohol dehydrogenase family)